MRACALIYTTALVYAGGHAALRQRRLSVGAGLVAAAPAAHLAYGVGVLRGIAETRTEIRRRRFPGRDRRADPRA